MTSVKSAVSVQDGGGRGRRVAEEGWAAQVTYVGDPQRHGQPDHALGGEEALEVLELADELHEALAQELLSRERARRSLRHDGLVRGDRLALRELFVEKAEVVDGELRLRLLVELGDFVQDVDGLRVAALGQEELGPESGSTECQCSPGHVRERAEEEGLDARLAEREDDESKDEDGERHKADGQGGVSPAHAVHTLIVSVCENWRKGRNEEDSALGRPRAAGLDAVSAGGEGNVAGVAGHESPADEGRDDDAERLEGRKSAEEESAVLRTGGQSVVILCSADRLK